MNSPSYEQLTTWATAIATIIIMIRQQTTKNDAATARIHAQDAAAIGLQTFHLVNGQMSAQLRRTAVLANKIATLTPNDEEAQGVAVEANKAVLEKDKIDDKILRSPDTSGTLNRLSKDESDRKTGV